MDKLREDNVGHKEEIKKVTLGRQLNARLELKAQEGIFPLRRK